MAKIHPIETCIGCGNVIRPLISENKKQWKDFWAFVAERQNAIPKDKRIDLLSPRIMIHDEADVLYFLCPDCCRDALHQLLSQIIARHRRILFQKFDKIRKELRE